MQKTLKKQYTIRKLDPEVSLCKDGVKDIHRIVQLWADRDFSSAAELSSIFSGIYGTTFSETYGTAPSGADFFLGTMKLASEEKEYPAIYSMRLGSSFILVKRCDAGVVVFDLYKAQRDGEQLASVVLYSTFGTFSRLHTLFHKVAITEPR